MAEAQRFNLLIVGQSGRLSFEAILLLASLRRASPDFAGRIIVAEPAPGPLWPRPMHIKNAAIRAKLEELGAEILPFDSAHFGAAYPYGNKIEALKLLPEGEPFLFLDTDTLILDDLSAVPFDFDRPSASLRVTGTWPEPELYGPGYTEIWKSLYDRFDLDFESSLDLTQPEEYWRRHLYFNAGFFYYRCPQQFHTLFLRYALEIRDNPPDALICQKLEPWLDQIALPLVIHALGGGRDALAPGFMDGSVTCHYRMLPLLYARESDAVVAQLEAVAQDKSVKPLLKQYDPIKFMVYHGRGHKVRALFDQDNLPRREQAIRNQIRKAGHWMR